jgi:hypothetical protein
MRWPLPVLLALLVAAPSAEAATTFGDPATIHATPENQLEGVLYSVNSRGEVSFGWSSRLAPMVGTWPAGGAAVTASSLEIGSGDLVLGGGGRSATLAAGIDVFYENSEPVRSVVKAATRPAGGVFRTPVTVADVPHAAAVPAAATGRDGTAAIAWLAEPAAGGEFVEVAVGKGDQYRAPRRLSGPVEFPGPRVIVDDEGRVRAAWVTREGRVKRIVVGDALAGGKPRPLTAAGDHVDRDFRVATDPSGAAALTWSVRRGRERAVQVARDVFAAPPRVETLTARGAPRSAVVAVGEQGDVAVAWIEKTAGGPALVVRRARAGGRFGRAETVARGRVFNPSIAVDGNGATAIAWGARDPIDPDVRVAAAPRSGRFQKEVTVGRRLHFAAPVVRASGDRIVAAVYYERTSGETILAAVAERGRFGRPHTVRSVRGTGTIPGLSVGLLPFGDGNFHLAWLEHAGGSDDPALIQVATLRR